MPKVILTPDLLKELAGHVSMGRMNKLKITRYKSGAKAGQLFAEYSLRNEIRVIGTTERNRKETARFLKKAADVMKDGYLKEIFVLKTDVDNEVYTRSLETKKKAI